MEITMKLLVVEDDERVVEFVKSGLQAEGFSVDAVGDGESALPMAREGTYGVIILDRMLPKLDGTEVCRQLRGEGVSTPILMLTARDTVDEKIDGFGAGADDYLTKPFAFAELVVRITALLRRSSTYHDDSTERLQCGDLILDRQTCEVRRGDRIIELTPKEFSLLAYLMGSAGIVVSKTRILDSVWGYDSDPLTNIVEVYIRHLRRKIESTGEAPMIHTVRGFGYKLDQPKTL